MSAKLLSTLLALASAACFLLYLAAPGWHGTNWLAVGLICLAVAVAFLPWP